MYAAKNILTINLFPKLAAYILNDYKIFIDAKSFGGLGGVNLLCGG